MAKCELCKDTGVIETGNNDLPCECPAGDTALFNDAELGTVPGKALKVDWCRHANLRSQCKTCQITELVSQVEQRDREIERQEARIEVLQGHVDKLVARIDHPNMLSEDL